jgi:SAM-dependent methyltransferase
MADPANDRRGSFDRAAALYDAARPGYPEALVDDVVSFSRISPGGRILEIGCGTGQATLLFARRGYRIQCIELGANLAAVARRNLAPYPSARVWVGAFEDWPLVEESFDLAVSATAFHWVDPAVGYPKVAHALAPGGALAFFWNRPDPAAEDDGFSAAVQAVYQREAPALAAAYRPPRGEDEAERVAAIEQTGLFGPVTVRRYRSTEVYDAARYLRLLETYSDHAALDPVVRSRLYRGIGALIDTRFGGQVTKGYLTLLYLARRKVWMPIDHNRGGDIRPGTI